MSKKIIPESSMGSNAEASRSDAKCYSALAKLADMLEKHWPPEYLNDEMLLTICLLIASRPGYDFWDGTAREIVEFAHAHNLLMDVDSHQVSAKIREAEKIIGYPGMILHFTEKKLEKEQGPIYHFFFVSRADGPWA